MTSILVVVFIVGLLYLAVFVEHFRDVCGSRSHGRFIGSGGEHGDAGGYSSGVSDCGGAGDGGGGAGGGCG